MNVQLGQQGRALHYGHEPERRARREGMIEWRGEAALVVIYFDSSSYIAVETG